jgi:hypothetical protein
MRPCSRSSCPTPFDPHPDHAAETAALRKRVGMVIESMGLLEVSGEDLAGGGLKAEIDKRIRSADALVALLTPHNVPGGAKLAPPWIADEFTTAKTLGKPAIRIIHGALTAGGMYAGDEHIPFGPDTLADTLIKLMRTLALWKRQAGQTMQLEIAASGSELPAEAARAQQCEVQVFADFTEGPWTPAKVWPEPGALYTVVRGVPEQAKLRLRLNVGGAVWQSDFQSPVGRVLLKKSLP